MKISYKIDWFKGFFLDGVVNGMKCDPKQTQNRVGMHTWVGKHTTNIN